ncbi:hypothetical protein ACK8P5_12670 [Paenibacillus sp. EC2-1]|uniref:hypothetical protein n=1 Tax=Paenibacillus sp. EC2-1 TaxID=3388665 RepID=UPI003BEEE734
MDWQNIDEIYTKPPFSLVKGNIINLTVKVEGDFEQFESSPLGMRAILTHWIYQIPGKDIKPFKLQGYSKTDKSFSAELKICRKSKEVDELRLFCEDIAFVFDNEDICITSWEVKLLEG